MAGGKLSMDNQNSERSNVIIGSYTPPDENGNGEIIKRVFFRQGKIFKDYGAFYNNPEEVCYIPELSDTTYTGNNIRGMCNNQEDMAEELFEQLDWQHPESLKEDWLVTGEWDYCDKCGKLFDCYGKTKCPHCGSDYNGGK